MKKMKRAFTTLACMDATIDEVIAYAKRNRIEGVEIRLDKDQKIIGYGIEEAAALRAKFEESGVVLTDLATGVGAADYSEKQLALGKECVDLAAAVGCPAIRVFVGGSKPHFTDVPKENFDGIVRFFAELCDYAAPKGVKIWAETHSSFSTAASMKKLMDAVQRDNLEILWDVIHTIEFFETPAESVRILGDKLAHVHLKDGRHSGDKNRTQYHHTKLGEGEMPIDEVMRLLSEADFDGYLSLEWELPWRPELQGCYKDTDETLAAYNKLLDDAENNAFPPFSDEKWTTFCPPDRELAEFKKGEWGDNVSISVDSTASFGLGKWLCTVPVKAGGTYEFSVSCRTKEPENSVYVVLTQANENGKWSIREHAANAVRDGEYIRFSDKIAIDENAETITLELWLKGYQADVTWYQPHLVPCAPIEKRLVRAAAVHIKPTGRTYEVNRDRILQAVDNAGALNPDIIVIGECMYDRGIVGTYRERSESEKGVMIPLLREKAKQYHSYIIYNLHESDNGEYYNTSILLDREGKTAGKYRKTHLTLTELEGGLTPGTGYPVFDTDFGRIGMLICYDQYFSATAEAVIAQGAEMIFISTAGDASHKSTARAMDGGVYLVIAGMNASQSAPLGVGPTRIVTPDGEVLAHTDEDLTPVIAEIDLNEKQRMFWLSVGPAEGEIHGIYRFEKNPKSFGGN